MRETSYQKFGRCLKEAHYTMKFLTKKTDWLIDELEGLFDHLYTVAPCELPKHISEMKEYTKEIKRRSNDNR